MGFMAKHLTKISKFGGQFRLTIPKGLIEECKWQGVEFMILERMGHDEIKLRRFVDAESLGIERKEHRHGSDR